MGDLEFSTWASINKESYYVWRVFKEGSLCTPMDCPRTYEHPFNCTFDTKKAAYQGLIDFDVVDYAKDENWILCLAKVIPVERLLFEENFDDHDSDIVWVSAPE